MALQASTACVLGLVGGQGEETGWLEVQSKDLFSTSGEKAKVLQNGDKMDTVTKAEAQGDQVSRTSQVAMDGCSLSSTQGMGTELMESKGESAWRPSSNSFSVQRWLGQC